MSSSPSPPVPVTVLTGYLGAGKTTLLNRILTGDHGLRYAVIVNEFGEIGIDNDLIASSDEEVFEMNNGCVCCTVRGDLIRIVNGLMRRQSGGGADGKTGGFDAIVVETTGLADPGPVAQTFFVDDEVRGRTRLDSVTTVVDALHVRARIADSREAREQIGFADQIVLNKVDLVSADELAEVEAALRRLNPLAPVHRAVRSEVPLEAVLNRGGFDLQRITELQPDFLNPAHGEPGHVHDDGCNHEHGHDHDHDHGRGREHGRDDADAHGVRGHAHADQDIRGVSLSLERPVDGIRVTRWLNELLEAQGPDILRAKGILDVEGEDRRLVFQAVHMILEGELQREWGPNERRWSRMVFIGRNLDETRLRAGFEACAA